MAYWANSDPTWLSLSGPQRAAAMALMEANVGSKGIDKSAARNALGAMVNRSEAEGVPLGEHVSGKIYQPTIEDNQRARLKQIIESPEFTELTQLAQSRASGAVPDWVSGATHFLAPPSTMLALEAREPNKYKSWRKWTGFNPETGQYANTVLSDGSHVFLKPEGANSSTPKSPPATLASGSADKPPAPNQSSDAMFPFLAKLFSSALAGGGGSAIPGASAAGAATPMAGPELGEFGGLLNDLFGGGQPAQGGTASAAPTSGPTGDLALAQSAQKNAVSGMGGLPQSLQRNPIDLSQLQAMVRNRPMLGYRG